VIYKCCVSLAGLLHVLHDSIGHIHLTGGTRVSFKPKSCKVISGTFGLASVSATLFHDKPIAQHETSILMDANAVLSLLHQAAATERASNQSLTPSSLFANALHLSGAGGAPPAHVRSRESKEPSLADRAAEAMRFAALVNDARSKMTIKRAESLSLHLAACMPVDLEKKRQWITTDSTGERLSLQLKQLQFRNLRMATAIEIMRQPQNAILRDILNMPYTQAVQQ
jgi:hypothetical protein